MQSIMSYNGGAVMAMRGKECVAIAADRRFGVQAQMVTTDFQKVFPMGERLYIGLAGLATDVQTVYVFFNLLVSASSAAVFIPQLSFEITCVAHVGCSSVIFCFTVVLMFSVMLYVPCTDFVLISLPALSHFSLFRAQRLKFRLNLYELKEGRQIKPKTFMSMVSNLLYERR